jgi:hypothetical protein
VAIIVSQQRQERVEIRVSLGLSKSAGGDITSIGALRPYSEDLEIDVLFEEMPPRGALRPNPPSGWGDHIPQNENRGNLRIALRDRTPILHLHGNCRLRS